MTRPRRATPHRPRNPHPAQEACKAHLRAANERILAGTGLVLYALDAGMQCVLGACWRACKSWVARVCAAWPYLEMGVILLGLLPLMPLLYALGVVVVVGEECVGAVGRWRWRWRQPRRRLLGEKEIEKRVARRRERDGVGRARLGMRPRALTLRSGGVPLVAMGDSPGLARKAIKQRTVDQLEACDLWRFPFEVREAIWKYAVGGNHVHIVRRRGRWGSVYCPADDPTDPVHRDFCVRRDDEGYYVKSAWPKDMRPLSLLVSCRQVYSECIDFLYSHNTFAFDEPALLYDFMSSLLLQRASLVTSFHLAPVFVREWDHTDKALLFVRHQPSAADVTQHLSSALNILAQHPTNYSLSVTPKLRLDFQLLRTPRDTDLRESVAKFTHALNTLKTSKPITFAWPEDLAASAPPGMANLSNYWNRETNLPPEEDRNFQLREMPWQSPTVLMAFFIPFDVRCLHCASYTIIRRGTRGFAEVSLLPLSLSPDPPESPTLSRVIVRYWTFHVFCGGWIEFQYHGGRKEWSATQGAEKISQEDADGHLATKEGLERRYPVLENPHERLRAITVIDVVGELASGRWSLGRYYGMSMGMDEPTREAYYRNVGWERE